MLIPEVDAQERPHKQERQASGRFAYGDLVLAIAGGTDALELVSGRTAMLEKFERYPLTFGPTPIEKLDRLSA
ncbi:MAG: hypothetical protein ACREJ0_02055, partial [Geminicoccaceae bacterium]